MPSHEALPSSASTKPRRYGAGVILPDFAGAGVFDERSAAVMDTFSGHGACGLSRFARQIRLCGKLALPGAVSSARSGYLEGLSLTGEGTKLKRGELLTAPQLVSSDAAGTRDWNYFSAKQ